MLLDVVRAPGSSTDLTFLAPLAGFGLLALFVVLLRVYLTRARLRSARAAQVVAAFNTPMKTRIIGCSTLAERHDAGYGGDGSRVRPGLRAM